MKDEGMMGLTQQKPRNAQDRQQTTKNQRSNMGQILPWISQKKASPANTLILGFRHLELWGHAFCYSVT